MTAPALELPSRRRIPLAQELGLLVVLALLYIPLTAAGFHFAPAGTWNLFLGLDNQINGVGYAMSIYAIMAVGMTGVIITGGIDISVGAIMCFSGLAAAKCLELISPGAPGYLVVPLAFLVPAAVGGLWGFVNGALVVGLRMHPFIVTLGTLSIIRGLCVLWFPPTLPTEGKRLPDAFTNLMTYDFNCQLRLMPVIIMLLVVAIAAVFLHALVAGRETYAVGGNPEAARFSGIRVGWVTLRVYVLMGICCGIAAAVDLGRFFSVSTDADTGYELQVIASAVVGGASLTGGRGGALGALLGTLIIAVIENGITVVKWRTENTKVIVGISIIAAVAVDRLSDYLVHRHAART